MSFNPFASLVVEEAKPKTTTNDVELSDLLEKTFHITLNRHKDSYVYIGELDDSSSTNDTLLNQDNLEEVKWPRQFNTI